MMPDVISFFKRIPTLFFMGLIVLYQRCISPFLPGGCRFLPTCSVYGLEALKTHGLWRGSVLTLKRVCRCHPIKFLGSGSGLDPVPTTEDLKKQKHKSNETIKRV